MTDESLTEGNSPEAPEVEFLLSGDDIAESFMGLVSQSDPLLLRTVYSNTVMLYLAKAQGNPDEMSAEEFQDVLTQAANDAFDLIVKELEGVRDAKIRFAQGDFQIFA